MHKIDEFISNVAGSDPKVAQPETSSTRDEPELHMYFEFIMHSMVNYKTLRGHPQNTMEQAGKPCNLARAHREIVCLLSELAGCLGKARCKSDSVHRA